MKTSKITNLSEKTTNSRKIEELITIHGDLFRHPFENGRIPEKSIGNFFGRAAPRQRAILKEMQSGKSYSKAYELSSSEFDTKRWDKVFVRTAAARGHILQSLVRVYQDERDGKHGNACERDVIRELLTEIISVATRLSYDLLKYELLEASKQVPPRQQRVKPDDSSIQNSGDCRFNIASNLKTALSKLKKTARDVPQTLEQLGSLPSVIQVAKTLVELGRILSGTHLFLAVRESCARECDFPVGKLKDSDPWGIGKSYADSLVGLQACMPTARSIATHCKPDADALVAAWVAERYLFPGDRCHVVFVPRSFIPSKPDRYDCVVDVGCEHSVKRRLFDHKPPAFIDRNETCAAKLVWDQVRQRHPYTKQIDDLVNLVHSGDANTLRSRSARYRESRKNGLHAIIRCASDYAKSDQMLYQAIKVCLDTIDSKSISPWLFQTAK
jgi:hypothetical protein